jgi:FkbM family methyltransferase
MSRVFGMMKNMRNWPAYLLHKWGIQKQNPFVLKSLNGVEVEVPNRMMHTAKEVFFTDDYKFDQVQEKVLGLSSSPIIVDVGANVGYLSAFSFTRFPEAKVLSVEPLPKNLELLKRNQERNPNFSWSVFEGVLSGVDGQTEIQFDNSDDFSTSASMYGLDDGADKIQVQSLKLSSLLSSNQISEVHILKLDCEGAEYDILYALSDAELNRVAFITMETHQIDSEKRNRDAVLNWLQEKGWKTQFTRSKVLAENPNFK